MKANHDVNKGGVVITITEMCFKNKLGANLDFTNCYDKKLRDDEFLFSETVGRFVIEASPKDLDLILDLATQFKIDIKKIGMLITKPEITVSGIISKQFKLDLVKMKRLYDSTIPNLMEI